jgi:hypothetical protein
MKCETCDGDGWYGPGITCKHCDGRGSVNPDPEDDAPEDAERSKAMSKCGACSGSGWYDQSGPDGSGIPCSACGGSGNGDAEDDRYEAIERIRELEEDLHAAEDFLLSEGYVICQDKKCNCAGWHKPKER